MTQENKELLIKDLCARLPYGVKFACNKNIYTAKGLDLIVTDEGDWEYAVTAKGITPIEIDFIKPCLFPISSMTNEQKREFDISMDMGYAAAYNAEINCANRMIDFFNKYHLDYRGLIPMGMAIDATGKNIY